MDAVFTSPTPENATIFTSMAVVRAAVLADVQPANEEGRTPRRLRERVGAAIVNENDFRWLFDDPEHGVDFTNKPGQIFRLVIKRDNYGKKRIGIHQALRWQKNRIPSMTLTREEIKTIQSPHIS